MGAGNNYGNRLDNRQRGNASQLLEKYRALARDAQQAGDRVTAEYYLQYADHYYRVLGDYREKTPNDNRQRGREFYDDDATGYAANGDDGDTGDDDDQDGDRNDERSDEPRSQWRDERPNNNNGGGNRSRDAQREPRSDGNRSEGNRNDASRNDASRGDSGRPDANRPDPNRNEGRDRQGWNANGRSRDDNRAERPREDNNRSESRSERPRDDNRSERPRDDNRPDRNDRRERRPEAPRPAPVDVVSNDEGPIPGLPGPATLRVKRPDSDEPMARVERAPRPPRREAEVIVAETPAPVEVAAEADVAAPRKRGRPRKVVDAAPVEG
jgi:hypothetical protein